MRPMNATACPPAFRQLSRKRPRRRRCRGSMAASIFRAAIDRGPGAGPLHRRSRRFADHGSNAMTRCLACCAAIVVVAATSIGPGGGGRGAAGARIRRKKPGPPGISSVYEGEWEFIGRRRGVAIFDCFGRWLSPTWCSPAVRRRPNSIAIISGQGDELRFLEEESGLEIDRVAGAYPLDVDGDGIMDLVLLRVGREPVYARPGRLPFRARQRSPGVSMAATPGRLPSPRRGRQAATGRTIAIGNYIEPERAVGALGARAPTIGCTARPMMGRVLLPPLPLTPSYCPLSMLFTDWNRSGTPALRVSNGPRILPWRPGADVAHGTGRTAAPLHRGGGLEAPAHLGHGHRRL